MNPKNLIPAMLTGGLSYGLSSMQGLVPKPPDQPGAPPPTTPPPTMLQPDVTAQQRAKKLSAMRFGFASTISGRSNPFANSVNPMSPQKTKLGQ